MDLLVAFVPHMIKLSVHNDYDMWSIADHDHLWVFDKLIVAKKAGHVCGPRGMPVPKPDFYMVRPISNFEGMGIGARKVWLDFCTLELHPGEFWCEFFTGDHISVDYHLYKPVLTVKGIPHPIAPHSKFIKWEKLETSIPQPAMLGKIPLFYKTINCEFIGGKLIEIHLRGNPDFVYGNNIAIPVWEGEEINPPQSMRFVEAEDTNRLGFYIDS
jgi:hypothetical protein